LCQATPFYTQPARLSAYIKSIKSAFKNFLMASIVQ